METRRRSENQNHDREPDVDQKTKSRSGKKRKGDRKPDVDQ